MNVSDSLFSRVNLNESKCFTDSQVTLFWIKGIGRDWNPFVHNQVSEIRRLILSEHWSHCLGKDNPADVPSRGCTPAELSTNQVWRYGPVWLCTLVDSREPALPEEIPEPCPVKLKARDQAAEGATSYTLEYILVFFMGASRIPPLGFTPTSPVTLLTFQKICFVLQAPMIFGYSSLAPTRTTMKSAKITLLCHLVEIMALVMFNSFLSLFLNIMCTMLHHCIIIITSFTNLFPHENKYTTYNSRPRT